MEKLITAKNQSIFRKESRSSPSTANACNCRQQNACPVRGKCLNEGIVYQAIVTREDSNDESSYVGLAEGKFKTRYANHNTSFRHEKYRNSTELSKHVWSLKDADVKFSIKWKILKKCKPYSAITKARFKRRILHVPNAIQTIHNEIAYLIIYCLDCIRCMKNSTFETGLSAVIFAYMRNLLSSATQNLALLTVEMNLYRAADTGKNICLAASNSLQFSDTLNTHSTGITSYIPRTFIHLIFHS